MKIQTHFVGLDPFAEEAIAQLVRRSSVASSSVRSEHRICFMQPGGAGWPDTVASERAFMVGLVEPRDFDAACGFFRAGGQDVLEALGPNEQVVVDAAALDAVLTRAIAFFRNEPPLLGTLADMERLAITRTLQACRGQMSSAARSLGIGRSTLYRKVEYYGIEANRIAIST